MSATSIATCVRLVNAGTPHPALTFECIKCGKKGVSGELRHVKGILVHKRCPR